MTVRYYRHPDIRLTDLDDEGIVLHLGSRRYFTVSETGLILLEALRTECTEDDLVERLRDAYDVSYEQAAQSVRVFLARCADAKLILMADSTG